MQSEIFGEKWNALKDKVKQTFDKLTDEDLLQIQGSAERMIGALQTRYGYSKDQAQQEWEQFAQENLITSADTFQQMADTGKATPKTGS